MDLQRNVGDLDLGEQRLDPGPQLDQRRWLVIAPEAVSVKTL
ncbi:MAG TPA: hypothetical protein VF045_06660 [Acidimicrobiales bacterium]